MMYKKREWGLESLRSGFARFLSENDRYPTATDIDSVEYLPSSRQIQRVYGGIVKLRETLGLGIADYTKGESRSSMAREINRRGNQLETGLEQALVSKFGKHFVHTEKKISNTGKSRFDFYVFTKKKEIGVDVFYPSNFHSLTGVLNFKQKKYKNCSDIIIYFVCGNRDIAQKEIEKHLNSKTSKLKENFRVLGYNDFITEIAAYERILIG